MNYREMIEFIGYCLGLAVDKTRKPHIKEVLESEGFCFENLVQVSSGQFVLPALYVQFRENDLLSSLPNELVEYLYSLHQLNAERNQSILDQAIEINELLNLQGIKPVFLKGTAHLIDGLYSDKGERLIGDIDLLLPEHQLVKAVDLLLTKRYRVEELAKEEYSLNDHRHFPRLKNEQKPCAIELHREVISSPYSTHFKGEHLLQRAEVLLTEGECYQLGHTDLVLHNMLNTQLNDGAYHSKALYLRNLYDLLLLSKQTEPQQAIATSPYFYKQCNGYLCLASQLFQVPDQLQYKASWSARWHSHCCLYLLSHSKTSTTIRFSFFLQQKVQIYLRKLIQATFIPSQRRALQKKLGNAQWYKTHFKQYSNFFGNGKR